jgi:hypothetical protein
MSESTACVPSLLADLIFMITLPPVEVARRLLFPPLLTFERPAQEPFANPDHSGFAPSSPAPHIEPLLPNIFALLPLPWFIPSIPL